MIDNGTSRTSTPDEEVTGQVSDRLSRELLVYLQGCRSSTLPGKLPCTRKTPCSQVGAQLLILKHMADGGGQRVRLGLDQQTRVAGHFRQAAAVARHHWSAAGHRLERRQTEPFLTRWKDETFRSAE